MKNIYWTNLGLLSFFIGIFIAGLLLKYIGIIGIFIFLGLMALADYLMFERVFKKVVGG